MGSNQRIAEPVPGFRGSEDPLATEGVIASARCDVADHRPGSVLFRTWVMVQPKSTAPPRAKRVPLGPFLSLRSCWLEQDGAC